MNTDMNIVKIMFQIHFLELTAPQTLFVYNFIIKDVLLSKQKIELCESASENLPIKTITIQSSRIVGGGG